METGNWARANKFKSLIVVTSGWHMPRALIELAHELPDVMLVPYPVVSERMREEPLVVGLAEPCGCCWSST